MGAASLLFAFAICLAAIEVRGSCQPSSTAALDNFDFRIHPDISSLSFGWVESGGGGGGSQQTIPSTAVGPFAGRKYGGGDRKTIYGTRQYGSGYPYGAANASTIAGRPFPYGTWPISFGAYLGGQEVVGPNVDTMRPGGPLVTAQIGSTNTQKWPGLSAAEVYTMIGDRDSVLAMVGYLVSECEATPQWPTLFNASNPSIQPGNVIQYYRASSFALAYSGYNNSFALNNASTSLSLSQSSPLPSNISSSAFLKCLNSTIGVNVPIISSQDHETNLSTGALAGLFVGIIVGIPLLIFALILYFDHLKKKRAVAGNTN
jgi:hypothetical protein